MTLGISLGAILGLLVLSAFFSGSETALTAARTQARELYGDKTATAVPASSIGCCRSAKG